MVHAVCLSISLQVITIATLWFARQTKKAEAIQIVQISPERILKVIGLIWHGRVAKSYDNDDIINGDNM